MSSLHSAEISQLLTDASKGDKNALDSLMPFVYGELRRLARYYMHQERADHTLQTTALVNEAYIRLIGQQEPGWQSRAHFFAIAARVMRQVLIDHARSRIREKRGGRAMKLSLEHAATLSDERAAEYVALDDALKGLEAIDPRKSRVVELRFFGGLSEEESAEVLGVSSRTVRRDWNLAQAWLYREMNRMEVPDERPI